MGSGGRVVNGVEEEKLGPHSCFALKLFPESQWLMGFSRRMKKKHTGKYRNRLIFNNHKFTLGFVFNSPFVFHKVAILRIFNL